MDVKPPVTIDGSLVVQALIEQRNHALDELAKVRALVRHLEIENATLLARSQTEQE